MKKLFFVIAVNIIGMQAVEAGYPIGWRSLTSSVDTGFHSSQAQAFNAWLGAFGYQPGSCGTGGNYRFCDALDANGEDTVGSADVPLWCTNGTSPDGATCPPDSNDEQPDPDINKGPDNCSAMAGNPIHSGTGNKTQVEVDYRGTGPFPLEFSRTYNSLNSVVNRGALGYFWQSNLHITIIYDGVTTPLDLYLQRSGGNVFRFRKIDGAWESLNDTVLHTLVETEDGQGQQTGWRLSLRKGGFEDYDLNGRITRVTNVQGYAHHYSYNTAGRLIRVADDFGRVMQFQYDTDGRLSVFIDPDGHETHYNFQWLVPPNSFVGYTVLSSVTYPDQTPLEGSDNSVRQYAYGQSYLFEYGNSDFRPLLTSITDENGHIYAAWEFDSDGRAVVSEHHGGAERVDLTYNADGTTTVTNALGRQTHYTYEIIDGVSKVIQVEGFPTANCAGANKHYTYYPNGLLETKTDWQGTVTRYAYNSRGLETSRTEAEGNPVERTILTEWHPTLNRRTKVTEPGRETTWTYNSDGRVLTHTVSALGPDSDTQTWTYTYNAEGLIETVDGPRTDVNDAVVYTYDAQYNLRALTNALGHTTLYSRYDSRGNVLSMTDPNGIVTDFTYNPRGWMTQTIVRAPAGVGGSDQVTIYSYDQVGQITGITFPSGNTISYEYDGARRLTAIQDGQGNRMEYTLDAAGNRTAEVIKNGSGEIKKTLSRLYDELSRLREFTGAAGQKTRFSYDVNNNNTQIVDGRDNATGQSFDALSRLSRVTEATGAVIDYQHDAQDRLASVTDQRGFNTQYSYDAFDNLTQLQSPDTGVTEYTHDDARNIASQTDARGQMTEFHYDALNRLTQVIFPSDTSQDIRYYYDDPVEPGTCDYGIGRLCRVEDASGNTDYRYDHLGQLIEERRTSQGITLTTRYRYNQAGRLTQMELPSGRTVDYGLDGNGQVQSVQMSVGATSTSIASAIAFQPFGPMTSITLGNGYQLDRRFDLDYRLTHLSMPTGSSSGNSAPVADAGADQKVNEGQSVSLNGSQSTDLDGDVLSYSWTQIGGPAVTLSDAQSVDPGFIALPTQNEVTLVFRLIVTDTANVQSTDTVSVTITPVNLDSDSDGLPDWWEVQYGFDPDNPADASADPDGDGVSNLEEYQQGENPLVVNYATVVLDDSPIVYYRLDETVGTSATDSAGGDHGVYSGGTMGQQSLVKGSGSAVYFSGSEYMSKEPIDIDTLPTLSLESWVNLQAYPPAGKDTIVVGSAAYIAINDTGQVWFGIYDGSQSHRAYGDETVALNRTYHIVAVKSPGVGMQLYIDGELVGSHTYSGTAQARSTLFVGKSDYYDLSVSGVLDEVAVYDTALNVEQIWSHYKTGAIDSDNDGMADSWELAHGLDPQNAQDASVDTDGDELSNVEEFQQHSDPNRVPDAYKNQILASEPVAYWRLGEVPGSTVAIDEQGVHSGTYNGGTLAASGLILGDSDTSVRLSLGNWIDTQSNFDFLQQTGVFTLEAVVKLSDPNSNDYDVIMGNSWEDWHAGFTLAWDNRNQYGHYKRVRFYLAGGGSTSPLFLNSASDAITDSKPHHIAVVGDGSAVTMYVDGVQVATGSLNQPLSTQSATIPVGIGTSYWSGKRWAMFDGQIDEVAIYNKALTSEQIQSHYQIGLGQ